MGRNNQSKFALKPPSKVSHNPSWGEITKAEIKRSGGTFSLITPHGEK
ncbi:Uncharacterized protein dnm_042580 [Desulfonema magnum]|uniref:Uncharacterized protein n=1 Tax=Desulfonema magnum TaxID=45655 RepID=A0A975BMG5_9BACT|nr:Uncharacterized protein dnm_042580 [Desulfonema magnum]